MKNVACCSPLDLPPGHLYVGGFSFFFLLLPFLVFIFVYSVKPTEDYSSPSGCGPGTHIVLG